MKSIENLLFGASLVVCLTGCSKDDYDDSELRNEISSLKDRVTAIERELESMNSDITTIRNLLDAVSQRTGSAEIHWG